MVVLTTRKGLGGIFPTLPLPSKIPPSPFRAPPRYWQFGVSAATTIHLTISNSKPEVLGRFEFPIYSYSLIFLIRIYSPFTHILYCKYSTFT